MARVTESASQRVQESMRKAIERYEVLRAHIEGDPKRRIPACAQCLEVDLHPIRVRARCEAGLAIYSAVMEAVATASTMVSRARKAAGRQPLLVRGRFDLAQHIKAFYEYEFTGTLAPRPRAPGRTMLPTKITISAEQMEELEREHKTKAPRKAPAPRSSKPVE